MVQLADNRRADRYGCEAPYTAVRVEPSGDRAVPMEGHAYDVSESGLKFELEQGIRVGEPLDLELHMPGAGGVVRLTGRVVRVFDELDDPGPCRMAVQVDSFHNEAHRARLLGHIRSGYLSPQRRRRVPV